jgi:hypothetical protein
VVAEVEQFRSEFRAKGIGRRYSGWAHFSFTSLVSLATVLFAATQVSRPRAWEWALLPVFFLVANLAEYFGHKGPMHHRRRGLALVFERHTRQHHYFFTHEAMSYESSRDFKMVLFPPIMIVFFLGGIATPIAIALFLLVSRNAGWLFVAVGVGYFLLYEWLHFAYHLDERSWLARRRLVALLRRHHAAHHDKTLMTRFNFNITFPIGDWLFGTIHRSR